ncbi:MAG TPA: hypothetical protein PK959_06595 [Candidatus Competibacteraceae bacterium]|nr:hypothetical protein [Candidatus Competibacteraceae bacterium]
MSTAVGFATARKQSRASTHLGWFAGGTLKVYTASRPASADTAISTQTLLATITLPSPAGTATDGVITFNAAGIDPTMIAADGTAAWARSADSSSAVIEDLDVGLQESGAALILDNLNLVTGGLLSVVSLTITEG